jgi:hypothetical protein
MSVELVFAFYRIKLEAFRRMGPFWRQGLRRTVLTSGGGESAKVIHPEEGY